MYFIACLFYCLFFTAICACHGTWQDAVCAVPTSTALAGDVTDT